MTKNNYNILAKFYNNLMGNSYADKYEFFVKKYLNSKNITNLDILELACGTGSILKRFSKNNRTIGIDLSPQMIATAKKIDKRSKYEVSDITKFKINKLFDVIICGYDSINHLAKISQWEKVFQNASLHLKNHGIFIFDFNTLKKLTSINNKSITKIINKNIFIITTKTKNNICNWNIKILIKKGKEGYQLKQENIKETSFNEPKISSSIKKHLLIINREGIPEDRIFVICKKQNTA